MKKILLLILILLIGASYAIGSYFVTFAIERGENGEPPAAVADIAEAGLQAPPKPNFPAEVLEIISADGLKLYADFFTPEIKSDKFAILVHGYGRDRTFAYDYAEEYLKRGYNVLIPDLRCAGESEGRYLTMGALESRDVALWAEKISAENPDAKIFLHGVSMGAATVMIASALEIKNLVAVVEDCGYTSAYAMFTAQLYELFGLPEYPLMPIVDIVSKIRTGVAISEASPISAVPNTKVPMLFIHGTADKLVPYRMMNELYQASNAPHKEIFKVEGATHAEAKNQNPTAYFDKVFDFYDSVIYN